MKKIILKIISVGFIVLGVLLFVFGLIKLARAQEPAQSPTIRSGIPDVEVIVPSPINTNQAQLIIVGSLATIGLGTAGLVISSRITEVSQNN